MFCGEQIYRRLNFHLICIYISKPSKNVSYKIRNKDLIFLLLGGKKKTQQKNKPQEASCLVH